MSNTGDGEEHQTGGELVAETTEFRGLTKSNSSDGGEFTDYESDENEYEGTFRSQPQVQSFIADTPPAAQHQDTVMEENDLEAVVDLTTGNTWESALDLTSD